MKRTDAEKLALHLMAKWKCDGWAFKWSHGKRQLGCAAIRKNRATGEVVSRQLRLSRYLVDLNHEPEVRDTILHEIAHIKAGLENGHNSVWKAWCVKVGARPERCYDASQVNVVAPKYLIVCKSCNKVIGKRMRRMRDIKRRYCKSCGPTSMGKLVIRQNTSGRQ